MQVAEGGPADPVVVPVEITEGQVRFTYREGDVTREFTGSLTRDALTGTFGEERVVLRRGRSYWE